MISNILVATYKPMSVQTPGGTIMVIVMFALYVGILVLVISFLIRMVKYFKKSGNEQHLIRMELGKLADEVQQLRQELKEVKGAGSSARSQ